ncbi:MAG: Superfamily and helicase-like protein [Glaciihabitans sp.]|nr:Superfamily and helicase-like protein [Glaciihabitans sp.]
MTCAATAFNLPSHLIAKAQPDLINTDERHFAAIEASQRRSIDDLTTRLDIHRTTPGGTGQAAMERDLEIHRITARLRAMRRFGVDVCLGRMVTADNSDPVYIGRFGLTDADGQRLLLDWRSPAAEPFFGATHANPMGLASRRRYRWTRGRISDYWDEVFTADGFEGNAALDDQSAFIASLGSSRSPRMRDVLGTIQADQDAIIRAGSRGAFVVDGGPGTGKTVVALHRSAYLLYSDPRLSRQGAGVLFVGPSPAYLAYVDDVLPSLGEDGVQTCTISDLVAEGAAALPETDGDVMRLKASADPVTLIDAAVAYYERPPSQSMAIETSWGDLWLDREDWAEAFAEAEPGTSHNDSRDAVWDKLLEILLDKQGDADDYDQEIEEDDGESASRTLLRKALLQSRELRTAFSRAWPMLDPAGVVGDLWSVPAYLKQSAPLLSNDEVDRLQRSDARAWTVSDLPFVDAAHRRIGDPAASQRRSQRDAAIAVEKARMSRVIDDLLEADLDGDGIVTMLRGQDLQDALVDQSALPTTDPDLLAGPFAHIVVDEAQELTDAEWQMLLARCPSRSFTIVGDRAQARHGFTESWRERLERAGFTEINLSSLSVNYRTPQEVMTEAEPAIRAALPDANVPSSIRHSGLPVIHASTVELGAIVTDWLSAHSEGIACVIGDPTYVATARVRSLSPEMAKGLEFDLVVVVDADAFGEGIEGAVDRYVAMTRATQQLVLLTTPGV